MKGSPEAFPANVLVIHSSSKRIVKLPDTITGPWPATSTTPTRTASAPGAILSRILCKARELCCNAAKACQPPKTVSAGERICNLEVLPGLANQPNQQVPMFEVNRGVEFNPIFLER